MRRTLSTLSALFLLTLLAACVASTPMSLRTSVAERVRIDGLAGDRVQLLNEGPGDLVFELVREKGPSQQVKIGAGMAWDFAPEGVRSIVVTHKGEGEGHVQIRVAGAHGGSIRATPVR